MDELIGRSDEIVVARAVRSSSRYEGSQIVTEIELERLETVRGEPRAPLTLVTPGGAVGNIGMRVEGAAHIAVGEEAVLFARRAGGGVRAVGMSQGVFPVRAEGGERWVHPSSRGLVLLRPDATGRLARVAPPVTEPVALDTFLAQVRERASAR